MQTQHLMIIGLGSALALLLLTYFIRTALLRALARSYAAGLNKRDIEHADRIAALTHDIVDLCARNSAATHRLKQLQQQAHARVTPLLPTDSGLLQATAVTLRLAVDTWMNFRGTEPYRIRAIKQAQQLEALGERLQTSLASSQLANGLANDSKPVVTYSGAAA